MATEARSPEGIPLPLIDLDNEKFWEGARHGKFLLQKCTQCGEFRFYPRMLCPHCHTPGGAWTETSGAGKVYTYTIIPHSRHPVFSKKVPYVIAIVELKEGPRLMTNIIDCDPKTVKCDMPVKVKWQKMSDEISLPYFVPA